MSVKLNYATNEMIEATVPKLSLAEIKLQAKEFYENHDADRAIRCYREGAGRGDGECQYFYAKMLQLGWGLDKPDTEEAMRWYRKAAEQNEANALYEIGGFYQYGIMGCPIDQKTSEEYYLRSAVLGQEQAREILIKRFEYSNLPLTFEERELIPFYRDLAKDGDVEAQLFLAVCELIGLHLERNSHEAFLKLFKLAESGNASSAYFVAFCYQYGVGVSKDEAVAFRWYQKAAMGGDFDAIRTLAYCKDPTVSKQWKDQAEDSILEIRLKKETKEHKGRRSVQDLKKSPEFYRFGAYVGDVNACYLCGVLLNEQPRLVLEWEDPAAYYEKAIRLCRHAPSARELYENFMDRYDLCRMDDFSYTLKDILAEDGDASLQYEMGVRYVMGDGVTKDVDRGRKFLKSAAQSGSRNAVSFLARYNDL